MLKILKIKAGIDSSYDNIYFDGTQKELASALNGAKCIPFLQKKVMDSGYKTIYIHARNIVVIEVDDYIKQEQKVTKKDNKIIEFNTDNYKEEEDINPFAELDDDATEFLVTECQKLINNARTPEEQETVISVAKIMSDFFVQHHEFKTDNKEQELKTIFEEEWENSKGPLVEDKELSEEKLKKIFLSVVMYMPKFKNDLDNLSKKETYVLFIECFLMCFHTFNWLANQTDEELKVLSEADNNTFWFNKFLSNMSVERAKEDEE